ncbi:unnamed protein product, partial [Didymodactylos carnosus]
LLISAVCEHEIEVIELVLGSVFPILLSSEGMPHVMRVISNFTPLTHSVEAMRCIASKGRFHFKVWFGFVIVSSWSAGFFIIAAALFALRK